MTPSGDDRAGAGDDSDLEVIELEPTEPAKPRRERSARNQAHRSRLPAAVAVVVLTALVGSVLAGRSHDTKRSSPTTVPSQAGGTPLFPFRVGARLLTAGTFGLEVIDTETGRRSKPRTLGLPHGRVTIVAHSGGNVAVRINEVMYWFSQPSGQVEYAAATSAFPGTRPGSLWLTSPRSAMLVPGPSSVPGAAIPTSGPVVGATRAGLVVATRTGIVLQPTGAASGSPARLLARAPATVIGVHADRVAWVSDDCGVLRCPVHITEVEGGATSTWLQLGVRPNPLRVGGTSAVFSPDGNHVAIVVPDDSGTSAQRLYVADLRSRVTHVIDVRGRYDQPARPGSADATGNTIDWTLDSRFLLLAPGLGAGLMGVMDPGVGRIVSSHAPFGAASSIAAIGTSTPGTLDRTEGDPTVPIDSGGPTRFGTPGLSIVGADDEQVDAVDIDRDRLGTWPVRGSLPNELEANTIARVTGGWLVVRDAGVFLLKDGGGAARTVRIGAGSQVFSSKGGRDAWIAIEAAGLLWTVEPYDPATGTIGPAATVGTPVGAVDDGLLVTGDVAFLGSEFDLVDRAGRMHRGPVIDSRSITVLAAAGAHVALLGSGGLFVLDLASGTNRLVTDRAVFETALSADGTVLAWIEAGSNDPSSRHVMATSVDGTTVVSLGGPADRVLAADDGTVLFTSNERISAGTAYADGSKPVYGFAPAPGALLALGYEPPPADVNLGPHSLP